jgi:hypothetical protein
MAITRLGPNQDITAAKIAGTINFKNLIINGDMSLAQRGTSVSGLTNGSSQYLIDRFRWAEGGAPSAVFTMSQDTDVPTGQGFAKSLKLDCTTAQGSLAAGDRFGLDTKLEGQNLQFLKFGTANAESLTLSFWVKSNKTGTYNIWIYKEDGTARSFASNYTISSASTWEKKTINIPADTAASGAIDNDNGEGFRITWMLAAGSNFNSGTTPTSWENYTAANIGVNNVNFADDVANNFWLTGVQLEADTSASDFEFLPYDVNLQRCQRYFQKIGGTNTNDVFATGFTSTNTFFGAGKLNKTMRSSPSASVSGTNSHINYTIVGVGASANATPSFTTNLDSFFISVTSGTGTTNYAGAYIRITNTSTSLHFDSEL